MPSVRLPVDLRELVEFAQNIDFAAPEASLQSVLVFASNLMTNVGNGDLLHRIATLKSGKSRTSATDIEQAALAFLDNPCAAGVAALLSVTNETPGVRAYRTGVLRSAYRALNQCDSSPANSFAETAIRVREQNRLIGRPLAKRSVGSTLLLKGLEAEVAVVLYSDEMDAQNLYVAMTRGSKKLVVCSKSPILQPRR